MRDFKKLIIWQKAMEIVNAVYQAIEKFPKEERYGLRSQVTRSAVSIASNIAEGSAKSSEKKRNNTWSVHWALRMNWKLNYSSLKN